MGLLRCLASCSTKSALASPLCPGSLFRFAPLLIAILLQTSDAVLRTRVIPTHSAVYNLTSKNSGGYCELEPTCTCVNNANVSYVHCKRLLDIVMSNCHGYTCVSLNCLPHITTDPYRYLTLLEMDEDDVPEIELTVTNCPLPELSYSSYLFPHYRLRENSSASERKVQELFINCGTIANFTLGGRHLDGFDSLLTIMINCTSLRTIPSDLLDGVSENLEILSITRTSLESVPKDLISRFPKLYTLDISLSRLKNLQNEVLRHAHGLNSLVLTFNAIDLLDDEIFLQTKELTHIQLSYNRLTKLPKSIGKLIKLRELIVNDNLIEFIDPECFVGLTSLQELTIDNNRIRNFGSDVFSGMKNLTTIHVSYNMIGNTMSSNDVSSTNRTHDINPFILGSKIEEKTSEVIPEDLFSSNALLDKIVIKNNLLQTLPRNIFSFNEMLTKADISSNKLIHLPSQLFRRNLKLRVLNLSNNTISVLPNEFLANQSLLESLNLSQNRITSLWKSFFNGVPKLEFLDLSDNLIGILPIDIFLPFNRSTTLKSLNLAGNKIQALPNMTIPSLINLNLAKNRLMFVGENVFLNTINLENLNLSHNFLDVIDKLGFKDVIKNFTSLDFSHNRLRDSLTIIESNNLVGLKFLNLTGNNLIGLRLIIVHSKRHTTSRYEYMDFSNNKLSHLEVKIVKNVLDRTRHLFSLKILDLSRNKLNLNESVMYFDHSLSTWGYRSQLSNFTSLEVLLLAHNEIVTIPLDWRHSMPNLRLLDLRHNKIKYLGHQDMLFSNGISPENLKVFGFSEKYYIKTKGRDPYYQYSDWHKLTVDLRHNLIEVLELQNHLVMEVRQDCFVNHNFGHATILLGNNPIVCGCQVFPLLRYAGKEIRPVSEREKEEENTFVLPATIAIDDLTCKEPPSVRGKNLSEPETWIHHLLSVVGMCHTSNYLNSDYQEKEVSHQ